MNTFKGLEIIDSHGRLHRFSDATFNWPEKAGDPIEVTSAGGMAVFARYKHARFGEMEIEGGETPNQE